MATYTTSLLPNRPRVEVFTHFIQPAWVLQSMPSEWSLQLIESPQVLELGSRVVLRGRRWGISQRSVLEVVGFEQDRLLIEEQKEGPFRSWRTTQTFSDREGGTLVEVRIDFEPPGGLLGLTVTETFVRRDLDRLFEHRAARLAAW